MPKLTISHPKYRKHKPSGQAVVTFNGRDFYLGPYGTKASRTKYDQLIHEWTGNGRQPLLDSDAGLTISELVSRYWVFVKSYYLKGGLPTPQQLCIRAALRPVLALYEDLLATEFGPKSLKAVRERMIAAGQCRQTVNANVGRIRRMFAWGVEEELIPVEVDQRLRKVKPLQAGRCKAPELPPVEAVADELVEAVLPHLTQTVSDMVQFQRRTACRPNEVCIMRPCDIDRTGEVWTYRPESHKTEHHNKSRVVFIGPQAQGILLRYLARDAQMYCFRPMDSEAKRRSERHAARTTPLSCGNKPGSNRKRRPLRAPTDRYTPDSYRRAIERFPNSIVADPDRL